MLRKLVSVSLFLAAMAGMFAVSDTAGAADAAKKDALKKKVVAAKKKKAEPLKTDEIFKKLFTVQPEPKGKKGKEVGPFDLEFTFKSLDANSDKFLSAEEFKGIVPAIFPAPKK